MNQNNQNDYNRLLFEDGLSIIFIILNILNIKANTIIEEAILSGNSKNITTALKLYRFIIVINIFANSYFVLRNYSFYQNAINKDDNAKLEELRLIGSLLILIGTLIIAYTIFSEDIPIGDIEL